MLNSEKGTSVRNSHILIVTPDADEPSETDLFTYEIECPGVTDACRRYEDCRPDDAERELLETAIDNEQPVIAHGARHLMFDGLWCAETDRCNVAGHDGLGSDVAGRFAPGRHPVEFDFGDGTEIVILPLDDQAKSDNRPKLSGGADV